jgi:heme-degrading monooxygenase HmoA
MIAVIFEVVPASGRIDLYLDTARDLRPLLDDIDGFISIERFRSLTDPTRLLSLSFWRDEAAVKAWRNSEQHRAAQSLGRSGVFDNYRLNDRNEVPDDSRAFHAA